MGELAVEDAHVAVGLGAAVGDGHGEAVARPLCLDGLVVRHGGDGDGDGGVWREKSPFFSDPEPLPVLVLADVGPPGEENWPLLSWASWRILKGPLTTWILFSTPASCTGTMECPAWIWCLQPGQTASPITHTPQHPAREAFTLIVLNRLSKNPDSSPKPQPTEPPVAPGRFPPSDAHLLLGSTSQMRASGLFWGIVLFSLGTCGGV